MKFNIPKIKEKINVIKEKTKKKKENNIKIQTRYYGLLFSMILLGVVTVATNIKTYNDITSENYIKYTLPIDVETDADKVEIEKYETAISSISTNISNIEEKKDEQKNEREIKDEYIWPLNGQIIREYAKDSLVYSKTMDMWLIHTGVDIAAVLGEEIKSIADGRVIAVENNSFYGNIVRINHNNNCVSIYAGLANIDLPKLNQDLKQGETVGRVGDTAYGEASEAVHLHFEIEKDGTSINPEEFLKDKE